MSLAAESSSRLPLEPRSFRQVVGEFATGVTVVTVEGNGLRAGMTLNSFTSVSLEPLLVLVSLARGSRTLEAIEPAGHFAINVLSRWQAHLALSFAEQGAGFPDNAVEREHDCLVVQGALAVLCCSTQRIIKAGDHDLVLGAVTALRRGVGEPLVFHRGRLGGLAVDGQAPGLAVGGWETSELLELQA